jgi:hypothetical protein
MAIAKPRWPRKLHPSLLLLPLVGALGCVALLAGRSGEHTSRPAVLGVGTAAAATPPPLSLVRYENPAYPYEIAYPKGWTAVIANPEQVEFRGPAGQQVEVVTQAVPPGKALPLPAYVDAQIETLRRKLTNPVELQRQRLALPNKQAGVEVDLTWTGVAGPQRVLLLYVLDGGVAFALRADAPASAFATERRLLEGSLRSFSLTPSD